jgi:hypothetical protein
MRKRAYVYARKMVWNRVAQSYMHSFSRAHAGSMQPAHLKFPAAAVETIATSPFLSA